MATFRQLSETEKNEHHKHVDQCHEIHLGPMALFALQRAHDFVLRANRRSSSRSSLAA
jgi:hypothetical protein